MAEDFSQRSFSLDKDKVSSITHDNIFEIETENIVGKWNGEDIRELAKELDRIEETTDVNYSALPHHEQIPADLHDEVEKDYSIWACDKSGNCLVGEQGVDIESADEIRKHYESSHGSIEAFKEKIREEKQNRFRNAE
ncbi:MAG: hypothetical protein ACE5EK_07535 [Nitrospinales bacterium]